MSAWPNDNETTLHMNNHMNYSISEIIDAVKTKWGDDVNMDSIHITSENIKTSGCSCCYDSSDYTLFLVITKND